jgi:hypothetical protein
MTFHGFIDREAAGCYLAMPNAEAATDNSSSSVEPPSTPPSEFEDDPPPSAASQCDELFATGVIGDAS